MPASERLRTAIAVLRDLAALKKDYVAAGVEELGDFPELSWQDAWNTAHDEFIEAAAEYRGLDNDTANAV